MLALGRPAVLRIRNAPAQGYVCGASSVGLRHAICCYAGIGVSGCVTEEGKVWLWGSNVSNQLGKGVFGGHF